MNILKSKYTGISLFCGAGGLDVGFQSAGINVVWANEMDKDACDTYQTNNPETELYRGNILDVVDELDRYKGIDLVFGGPPCQGFSVAGKMDPSDNRSSLIWTFLDVVEKVKPKAFVLENVKALAKLEKWKFVRERFIKQSGEMGYICYPILLNASNFGVPQNRERVFFVGIKHKDFELDSILSKIEQNEKPKLTIREAISHLGPAGTTQNPHTCNAKITLAVKPVMRKSPYAGMIFNGMGRPLNLDGVSNTLPASMGGNKTPIIDEELLYGPNADNWIVSYHKKLREDNMVPQFGEAPSNLRRITLKEAALIQTFPQDYEFKGQKSSIYRQIGNAVPCLLAEAVAKAVAEELDGLGLANDKESAIVNV